MVGIAVVFGATYRHQFLRMSWLQACALLVATVTMELEPVAALLQHLGEFAAVVVAAVVVALRPRLLLAAVVVAVVVAEEQPASVHAVL